MTTLQPGAMLTDNLLLERVLGHGGMGAVWIARNQVLGSEVAVKVLNVVASPVTRVAGGAEAGLPVGSESPLT